MKLLLALGSLAFLVILIAAFYRQNAIIFTLLAAATLIVFFLSRAKRDLIPFAVGAILGPTMEAIIIHFGAWQYANPSLVGIPVWLPLLWGLTAFFLTKIAGWLLAITNRI